MGIQFLATEKHFVLKNGWLVDVTVDVEKRLHISVSNGDGSNIVAINSDSSDGTDGQPLDFCLTTEKIEDAIADSIAKAQVPENRIVKAVG